MADPVDQPSDPRPARTLPGWFYTDPDYDRAERERFFGNEWVCIGREEQLLEPGTYLNVEVAGESLIVLRDDANGLRAFYNVCRHRGTRICSEPEGRTGHSLICPYHAWTYDLQGRLVGAPHMEDVPGFQREDYPLHAATADLWEGHVFVHLGTQPSSLADRLGPLAEKFRNWGMAELRRASRVEYDVRANWKLLIHNYSECLHCPVNHPALQKLSHYLSGVNEPATEAWLGGAMELRPGVDTLNDDGRARRPYLPRLEAEQRRHVYYYAVLPNLLLSLHPDYVMTHILWPLGPDRTRVVCEWHFPPETIRLPDFDPGDAVAFWDRTNREDWRLSELTQAGLSSRVFTPGPYSNREDLLRSFDQLILGRRAGRAGPGRGD